MTSLLCCRGPRSASPTLILPDSERLRTLQPASLVSIALPSDTVPHRPTTGIDETQALRDIFGASPSSHRGYQAAANCSGSFDTNFKFGRDGPTKPKAKALQPLGKVGHGIRQRLSLSRLSNHSSRKSTKDIKSTETVIHRKLPPDCQISTGLDELLVSRTVSEGGYDSDARGIQTPSWTKASAGSVLVSPEYTAKVLHAFDRSPSKRSASLPSTLHNNGGKFHSSIDMPSTPSLTAENQVGLEPMQTVEEWGRQTRVRATSTPKKHVTPQQESFSALLQLRPQDSPTDVLRRLSVGLANGTIKLPDTPELKAMRMPSIVEATPEWRLSFSAPKRASSLHRCDDEVRQALKTLSARVEKVKRDSAASDWTSDEKHVSLLSNLDPALLQYIRQYGEEDKHDLLYGTLGDADGEGKNRGAIENMANLDTTSHNATSGVHYLTSAQNKHAEHKPNASSGKQHSQPANARLESDKESVHLFDMKIPQRLASTSVLPTLSPSSTNLGSSLHYMDRSSQSFGKLNNFPTFITQTSAEHVRRPSDPRTRRLFEPDGLVDGRKIPPKWKSVVSETDSNLEQPIQAAEVSQDDASSVYMSDTGLDDGVVKSVIAHRAQSRLRPTSNSLAIAGRQGVLGIRAEQRRSSMGQIVSTDGQSKASLGRSVSEVRCIRSKFSKNIDIHQKTRGDKMESEGANTLANESMSLIDVFTTTAPEVGLVDRMSKVDSVGVLNEKLKSSIRGQHDTNSNRNNNARNASQGSMSNGPLAGDSMLGFASSKICPTNEPTRTCPRGRDECATNMWERALRTARADPSHEDSAQSFGSSFDQLRRDRTRMRRSSDGRAFHGHMVGGISMVPPRQSRSFSPEPCASAGSCRESFSLDRHQSLCVEAKKPLTRSTSPARLIDTKNSSLLDIRRFTMVGRRSRNNTPYSSSTPTRDIVAWTRFPSHTRLERNGPAAGKDGVSTRDFSPPPDPETSSSRNRSKLSLMTQPDKMGMHTPGSWKFLKSGHGRKKSRSMDFTLSNSGQCMEEKAKEKAKKNLLALTLTLSLAKWKRLYRGHSSDLRRFRPGHLSSVSKAGKVEFPELEIVPEFGGGNGARVWMEQLGDFEGECRKWNKERSRESSKGGLRGLTEETKNGRQVRMTTTEGDIGVGAMGNGVDGLGWSGSQRSSRNGGMEQRTPRGREEGAAVGTGNAWADIYQACIVEGELNDSR